ncbi:MAG TPA: SCO family protein [Gemmatimonadaceae bacterium]|nr:SCO family protein [Gemmatimonadaceae bacterium]
MTHVTTRTIVRALTPVVAALLALPACAPSGTPAPRAGAQGAATSDRYSVYDLGARWRDQRGTPRQLSSLRGRPQVIAMIYTHCSTTCPFTVAEMKRIERESRRDAGFVLVSLDPARDGPARLAEFARERGLDTGRWTLLDGSDDAVRELATVLGVRYRRLSPEELAHSNALTLLDADGVVAYQHAGLDAAEEITKALSALETR